MLFLVPSQLYLICALASLLCPFMFSRCKCYRFCVFSFWDCKL